MDLSDRGVGRVLAALHLDHQSVTFAKFALEVLGAAQTSELAVYHDRDSRTQCFTLFHAVKYSTVQCSVKQYRTMQHMYNTETFTVFVNSKEEVA